MAGRPEYSTSWTPDRCRLTFSKDSTSMVFGCHIVLTAGKGSYESTDVKEPSGLRLTFILVHSLSGKSGSWGMSRYGRHIVSSSKTSVAIVRYVELNAVR
jgi:hypothetical protein